VAGISRPRATALHGVPTTALEAMSVDDYRLMHDVNVNGCILGMRGAAIAVDGGVTAGR
jgi:hypothetical protein